MYYGNRNKYILKNNAHLLFIFLSKPTVSTFTEQICLKIFANPCFVCLLSESCFLCLQFYYLIVYSNQCGFLSTPKENLQSPFYLSLLMQSLFCWFLAFLSSCCVAKALPVTIKDFICKVRKKYKNVSPFLFWPINRDKKWKGIGKKW